MKKVLKLFTIIAMMLIVLTGCVEVNYEVTVNKDGTADISFVYGFEKEYLKEMETTGEELTEEMKKNAETSEYTVEAYSDDKIEGIKATKHAATLAEVSLEEAFGEEYVKESEENQMKAEKKGSKMVYSQNAEVDLTSMGEEMASYVNMKYTVKLPVAVGENNADDVSDDKKTLTWNLKAGEINKIQFEASESGILSTILIIVAIVVGVTVVAVIVVVVLKSIKKKKESVNDEIVSDVEENKNEIVEEKVKEEDNQEVKNEEQEKNDE